YKSGKSPKPGWEDKAFFQLRIYALIYWRNHGVIPKLLQLIYLGNAQVIKNLPSDQDLISTEKKLLQIGSEIREAIESDKWPTKPSRLCDWCSFKPICPAHKI
ncbi:MAG: exodeoxyribonuclease V subunit beta, partial [Actinobacteria bacterium]|nr:exodeoxyribonuclease V subunit beta [Actinomycetota bacterium]MSZ85405.1 exodeoxyribonuclease V subunit beta [Actinomycetota bacterium]